MTSTEQRPPAEPRALSPLGVDATRVPPPNGHARAPREEESRDAARGARQRLEMLASFVPDHLLRILDADPTPPSRAGFARVRGAVLHVDLVGFVALADKLAAGDRAGGAEPLRIVLGAFFQDIVQRVLDAGGDVLKFTGDGLLALWPQERGGEAAGEAAESLDTLALRATHCALSLPAELDGLTPLSGLGASLTCAVGVGDIAIARLGGMLKRWELLPAGVPLVQIRDAAWRAGRDEVVLSPEAWALVGSRVRAREIGDGFACARWAQEPPAARPKEPIRLRAEMEPALRAFIPAAALARLEEGPPGWSAELRRVNAIFVHLPLLGHDTPLHRGQEVLRTIQRAVYRHEGSLNKLSVDDKGASALIGMGLPPLPHTDDAERAIRVALDVRRDLRRIDVASSVGLATGRVLCGTVGAGKRREYTMIGRVVNLAARLMEAADGGILCDQETERLARGRFHLAPLPRLAIRGAEGTAAAFRPIGERARRETVDRSPIGRVQERMRLHAHLDGLLAGRGRVVVLRGEAGIGKSVVAEDLLGVARARGARIAIGAGDAMDRATPFLAWRSAVRALLELPDLGEGDDEPARRLVEGRLRLAPAAQPLVALLNPLLPVRFPESGLTRAMPPAARDRGTLRLASRLLRRAARAHPTLLLLEDAQWMDAASWSLARSVALSAPRLLFLLVTRPLAETGERRLAALVRDADGELLQIEGLSPADTRRLLGRQLARDDVEEALVQLVEAKARGNPFFIAELSRALRDEEQVASTPRPPARTPDAILPDALVPDSVAGAITRRLDGLTPSQRSLVRVASVIGPAFDRRMLADLLPRDGPEDALRRDLRELARSGLLMRDPRDPEGRYRFKHVLTREVAYRALLDGQRRGLHEEIARWIEREHLDDLPRLHGRLAQHWLEAGRDARALPYLESAAAATAGTSASSQAVALLGRALEIVERAPHRGTVRAARLHRILARARLALGDPKAALRSLHVALDLLGQPPPVGRGSTLRALLAPRLGRIGARLLPRRARRPRLPGARRNREAARAYELLAEIGLVENDAATACQATLQALARREAGGAFPALAHTYASAGLCASLIPWHGIADRCFARALRALGETEAPATESLVTARVGRHAAGAARWEQAERNLRASEALALRLDHHRLLGESRSAMAQLRYARARYPEVRRAAAALHDAALDVGDLRQRAWGLSWDALAALRLGELDEAFDGLMRARSLLADLESRGAHIHIAGALALTHLYRGHDEKARSMADAAARQIAGSSPTSASFLEGYACGAEVHLTLAQSARDPACRRRRLRRAERALAELGRFARVFRIGAPRAHLLRGRLHGLRGRERRARAEWRRCIRRARALGMPLEEGLALLELGLARPRTDARRAARLRQAADVFREIGAAHERARAQSLLADAEGGPPGA